MDPFFPDIKQQTRPGGVNTVTSLSLAATAAFALAQLAMGVLYAHAPCETDKFSLFLMVYGATTLFGCCLGYLNARDPAREENVTACSRSISVLHVLLGIFAWGWYITGSVWIFSFDIQPGYANCDRTLYLYTYWSVLVPYLLLAGVLVFGGLRLCFASIRGKMRAHQAFDQA